MYTKQDVSKRIRRTVLVFAFALVIPAFVVSQVLPGAGGLQGGAALLEDDPGPIPPDNRLALAISDPDYPVTPGDSFLLTFLAAGETINAQIFVDGNYDVNLGLVGTINARGMRVADLVTNVREEVLAAYPASNPSIRLTQTGDFYVQVYGAVEQATRVPAWGLSRLSDIVLPLLQPFSSIRRVRLESLDDVEMFDLFLARRYGLLQQDPVVKPGDRIELLPVGPVVEVTGEVTRPGRYEIIESDTARDLVDYVGGIGEQADLSRVRIEYITNDRHLSVYRAVSIAETESPVWPVRAVFVPPKPQAQRFVIVSGAVLSPEQSTLVQTGQAQLVESTIAQPGADESAGNQIRIPIAERETLGDLVVRIRDDISGRADLSAAMLLRDGVPVYDRIDLYNLPIADEELQQLKLRSGDRLYIPYQTPLPVVFDSFVVVRGAVYVPGRYRVYEGRDARYYIRQAGGADPTRSYRDAYVVTAPDGSARPVGSLPEAGDTITVIDDSVTGVGATEPIPGTDIPVNVVVVRGAVYLPGRYPAVEGKDAGFYIRLAGGANPELSRDGSFTIEDSRGILRDPNAIPQPGDTITVEHNDPVYAFNRILPVFTGSLTLITTVLAVLAIFVGF